MSITSEKKELRKTIKKQRETLGRETKKKYDMQICNRLKELIISRNCSTVHAYVPMTAEVDITPLLQYLLDEKITVVTSKTLKNRRLQHLVLHSLNEIEKGIFNTLHPANSFEYKGEYDLIIVPGLAFDMEGYRLGYGGGYYDSFLAEHSTVFKVGVAYPFQKVEIVPKESHDVSLDTILG